MAEVSELGQPISHRKFTFTCSLHGKQELKKVVFAGIELSCGCQVVDIRNEWVFTTREDRVLEELYSEEFNRKKRERLQDGK